MNPALQDTLLQLFGQVHHDPDSLPVIPIDEWHEGSRERQLLISFSIMMEQVQQRIYQLKQAEQQLREREEQYRSIFEATTDAMAIASLEDGIIVEVNPAECRMFGYSYEEMIGMHPAVTVHPDFLTLVTEANFKIQAGNQFQTQALALRKDGTPFPVEAYLTPFIYKGKPHTLSVARDITERVEAEQKLREREEQYRSVFEATYDGLIISNLDGFVVEVNPAFCGMYGFTREELLGLHVGALAAPESLPVLDEVLERRKTGMNYQTLVAQAMHKDGTVFSVESHGNTFTYRGQPHTLGIVRDITERVEAEKRLREKEEQYHAIFEATSDALEIGDLEDGHIVEANPAACKMFGYSYEELIGLPASATTHPDSLHLVTEGLQAVRAGHHLDVQGLGLRKDGTPFYVEARGTPFIFKGKPHLLTVSRDITERVEAEQQLREREEQYRSVFEATDDGLVIQDLEGFFIEVSPAFCRMLGYTHEELIGLHYSQVTYPEYYPVVEENSQKVQAEGRAQAQGFARRKDGSSLPVEAHSTSFTYKGKPHVLGVMRDITERVEAERQLREREEQYRGVFETTYDGLVISDLENGCYVEVNPAFCRMYGYTREELIGMHSSALAAPVDHHLVDEVLETLKAGQGYQTVVGQGLRKDGTMFYVESQGTTFTYRGKPHSLAVIRDITERVQAEQQLREKEEQYRNIFEASTDALLIGDLDEGYVVEANPAACQMYGYSYEEFIGLGPNDITPLNYQHLPVEARSTIKRGSQFQTQGAVSLRKDGTTFYVDAHTTPFTYMGKLHQLAAVRDVTERVKAEQQLREKEEQYRSIFEATYDALFIMDLDGFLVEVNPAFCRMFGYSYEEVIGLHASVFAAPVSLPNLAESLKELKTGRDIQTQVGQGLRKDGTVFYNEAHSTTFTYRGKPHALGVVRDITERVEAEQQLREKEEQYRSIFESTYDAINILNLEGFFVEVNPAYCSMFGYSREELIGKHASITTAPEALPILDDALQTFKAGKSYETVGQSLRKDGTTFYVEAHGSTLTYQGRSHTLGIIRDITERVEAERQLREREEQYRSVFEATYDALVVMDLHGYFVEVNPAFCRMFGYTREELIGKHGSLTTAPDTLTTLDDFLNTLNVGRNYQAPMGAQGVRKDGTLFYAESHATIFTYQGKPHVLGIIRDITEQMQAQQLLEQRVEERTRELASLLEISHTVASTLHLKPLVGLILDQLKTVVDYTSAAIFTVEGDDIVLLDSRSPTPEEQLRQIRFLPQRLGPIWEMITSGQSIHLSDMRDESPLAQTLRVGMGELLDTTFSYVRASLFVPLTLKELSIGMLVLTSSEVGAFTPHHTTLALAIANQAAIAIENARLYEQAQELAAVEERQRLARELHDSVSQALYGISLGVHTARLQLDRDPRDLAESLDYVLELAEAALIEMRALIFELRPESLETEGLVIALSKQAAALHARQNMVVNTDLCAEPDLSLKVKQELYRVAQEALHNTVKHAQASRIELRLHLTSEDVILEVCDNGRGFDATASFPGHLGLHSMHERVAGLGGELQIESTPGQGTCIRVQIPCPGAM